MKTYIKILLGLIAWGFIFWYIGEIWLEDKRFTTCLNEVKKSFPNVTITQERCIQTAQKFEKNHDYGSAAWFYLLGGEISKNIEELEAKIDDNFTLNIGHSYLLQGDVKKARRFYNDFLWFRHGSFVSNNEAIQDDFNVLVKLYPQKKNLLEEGKNVWNELYEPLGKIAEVQHQYEEIEYNYDEEKSFEILEKLLQLSEPYKTRTEINYWSNLKALAERYYYSEEYNLSIKSYQKLLKEQNLSKSSYVNGEIYDTISSIYMQMAELYEDDDFYRDAESFAQKALLYKKVHQSKNKQALSQSHAQLATIFLLQFSYKKALGEALNAVALQKEVLFEDKNRDTEMMLSLLNEYYQQLVESYQGLKEYDNALEAYGQYINFLENEYLQGFTVFLGNAYVKQGDYLLNSDNTSASTYYKKAIALLKTSLENAWYTDEKRTYLNLLFEYSDHLKNTTESGYLEEMDELEAFILKTFPEKEEESLYLKALTNEKMYDIYKNINQRKASLCHKKALEQMRRVMKTTTSAYIKEEYKYFFKEISKEVQEFESNRTTQEN